MPAVKTFIVLKLLKNNNAVTFFPIKDVTYKDMKLILDFIYYGEVDVDIADVSSLIRTAELLKMTSLKHSVCHCFGEDFSCNDIRSRNINDMCTVSCTNLIRNDAKDLLKEQVQLNSADLYMRQESINSKSQNIQIHSIDDSTKNFLNDFEAVSRKPNKDQPKSRAPRTYNRLKRIPKLDVENVNDELFPVTFVAVSEIKEPIETHQDSRMCFDSVFNDPLGEYSGTLNVTEERNVEDECTFSTELQVKKEPKDEIKVPDSMMDDVLIADNLSYSFQESTSTKYNPFVSCNQDSGTDGYTNVMFSDAFCHEVCTSEETHDLKIKFESICEVSGTVVKDEKIFENGQCFNHSVGDDETETPPLESDAIYRSGLMQSEHCEERKELMQRTGNSSPHIAIFNTKKQKTNQLLVPSDTIHLDPLRIGEGHGQSGKMQIHSPRIRNYSCSICRKSYFLKVHLKRHMRIHTGEKPFQCEICKKSFSDKRNFKDHMRRHTGDKPFECGICKKTFIQSGHLKVHVRIHTGEKPFECVFCKKTFSDKRNLKRHVRIHTGENPYECNICKKSFIQNEHLKTHKRQHTGEKPFECKICKKRFNDKRNLNKHMRGHNLQM